jgi:hypothetical protein
MIIKTMCLILSMFHPVKECKNHIEIVKYKTDVSEKDTKIALRDTHIEVFGKPASNNSIDMAWAQIAIENGRGNIVYNYNLGNIGNSPNQPIRSYYKLSGYHFMSFHSIKHGAKFYWKTLQDRCPGALPYFHNGNAIDASIALKKCGYYKADLDFYSKNLRALFYETNAKR